MWEAPTPTIYTISTVLIISLATQNKDNARVRKEKLFMGNTINIELVDKVLNINQQRI